MQAVLPVGQLQSIRCCSLSSSCSPVLLNQAASRDAMAPNACAHQSQLQQCHRTGDSLSFAQRSEPALAAAFTQCPLAKDAELHHKAKQTGPKPARQSQGLASANDRPGGCPACRRDATFDGSSHRVQAAAHPAAAAHGLVLDRAVCAAAPPVQRSRHQVRGRHPLVLLPQGGVCQRAGPLGSMVGQHDCQKLLVREIRQVIQFQPAFILKVSAQDTQGQIAARCETTA